MTREDREFAKSRIEYLLKVDNCLDKHDRESLEMAIQALSQECVGSTQKHVGNALDMRCDDVISREDAYEIVMMPDTPFGKHKGTLIRELPSVTQKSGKYTADELRVFADGISLSLCSKKSAQHWSYDEKTAEQIRWLECLHSKVKTDIADMNCGAKMESGDKK